MKLKKDEFDLRHAYSLHLQVGMIATLLVLIYLFRADLNFGGDTVFEAIEQELIEMEEVIQTEQVVKPPPPVRPPVPVEVPNDEILEDMDLNFDVSLDLDTPLDLPPPPSTESEQVEDEDPPFFVIVEQEPELIGGIEGLQKKVKYPDMAIRSNVSGRVYLQFIVNENGDVVDPFVVKGIGAGCDEAALAAIKTAKFKPGKQRGKPVKVQYQIYITFRLR
jgi:protein TonB